MKFTSSITFAVFTGLNFMQSKETPELLENDSLARRVEYRIVT